MISNFLTTVKNPEYVKYKESYKAEYYNSFVKLLF